MESGSWPLRRIPRGFFFVSHSCCHMALTLKIGPGASLMLAGKLFKAREMKGSDFPLLMLLLLGYTW